MTAAKIHAGIEIARRQFAERGWEADIILIRPDETAGPAIAAQLALKNYDCVVIGAGVRLPPRGLEHYLKSSSTQSTKAPRPPRLPSTPGQTTAPMPPPGRRAEDHQGHDRAQKQPRSEPNDTKTKRDGAHATTRRQARRNQPAGGKARAGSRGALRSARERRTERTSRGEAGGREGPGDDQAKSQARTGGRERSEPHGGGRPDGGTLPGAVNAQSPDTTPRPNSEPPTAR